MTWEAFVLMVLATYRLTRLVTTDDLTAPLRLRLAERYPAHVGPVRDSNGRAVAGSATNVPSAIVVLVHCVWCMGIWVALGAALALHFAGLCNSWTYVVLTWLAAATVVGFLSRLEA